MISVQKQSHFQLSSPHGHTRRLPSVSAIAVQRTSTAGLLTLQKPVQRQQPQRPKQAPKAKSPAPTLGPALVLKPTDKRGRQTPKPKEKQVERSSTPPTRRSHFRQPSPPINTSQAEAPYTPPTRNSNSNLFDPFLDDESPAQSPILAQPTGKLAHHRSPSKAIQVPPRTTASAPQPSLSMSAPFDSHMPSSRAVKRSSVPVFAKQFPICDDMAELGDRLEDLSFQAPTTPPRRRATPHGFDFDDPPKTAPLSSSGFSFPFNVSPSPTKKLARKHVRSPSEGYSPKSSDENPGLNAIRLSAQRQGLFSNLPAIDKYAGSSFQNSPSPEELPPPMF